MNSTLMPKDEEDDKKRHFVASVTLTIQLC